MRSTSQPGEDPAVAATVKVLHRRQGWNRAAITGLIAFALAYGAYLNAQSQGTPPPTWFLAATIALGALAVVSIIASAAESALLRRKPAAIRAQAAPIAARHPGRGHPRHYPPRHWLTWSLCWVGMLLILAVAVISVPAVVDGVAYLTRAGHMVTFDPVSHQTNCTQYSCQTSTDGILETGGAGVSATWPDAVPLGVPFQIREPVWRWGLGLALIDGDGIAVAAILISLLIEGFAVLVVIHLVRLVRNWGRHVRQRAAPAAVPATPTA